MTTHWIWFYTITLVGWTYLSHRRVLQKQHQEQIEALRSLTAPMKDLCEILRESKQHLKEISPWPGSKKTVPEFPRPVSRVPECDNVPQEWPYLPDTTS